MLLIENTKKLTKKVMYFYGGFLLISWALMFFINRHYYSSNQIIEGMICIGIVLIIYFPLVHLHFRSKLGEKIVTWSMVPLAIIIFIGFYFSL